jgi:uncharacterized caspase-like protein
MADYHGFPLRNPVRDAQLMQSTLTSLGFEVRLVTNTGRGALMDALTAFEERAREADTALFYFAGHGVQIEGRRYLVPLGVALQPETEFAKGCVDLELVVTRIAASRPVEGLAILDAQFDSMVSTRGENGFSLPVTWHVPDEFVVAYATAWGETASDGEMNSPYTEAFARHLRNEDVRDFRGVFDRVRQDVIRATSGSQRPYEDIGMKGRLLIR